MSTEPSVQPTLWRTCRAIANTTRLKIFDLLRQRPGQTVSVVAQRMKLPLPVASQYLRVLEARGLLAARRVGLRVFYRPASAATGATATGLVTALQRVFEQDANPVRTIFQTATAFTHPRRIEIFHALKNGAQTLTQLQSVTRISTPALRRHLKKLEARGFVRCDPEICVATRPDALGRELARLASG